MSKQMYVEPVSPWALNATQLAALRQRVAEAEAAVAAAKEWTERTRLEQDLKVVQRELAVAEHEAQLAVRRQAQHRRPAPAAAPSAANVARQEYAQPVPYFAEPGRAAQGVSNAAPVEWPQDFVERTALLSAAMDELRRIGAAR